MGIRLDASRRQWIDLGIHLEACLTQPDTCGGDGGALGFWVRVDAPGRLPGIISSKKTEFARGFQLGYNIVGLV